MIRYAITQAELESRIDLESATWRTRAKARAKDIDVAKSYNEKEGIWSEIKNVYRRLQNQKCAFCERWLAGEPYGAIEHDVEHFRPKKATKKWASKSVPHTWHTAGRPSGYYWLAYDLLNYASSCKVCNTPLKGNDFPIAGASGKELDNIGELNKIEKPLLIYPISDIDEDPEKLIQFDGILAVEVNIDKASYGHRRAAVTIEFFALNERDELHRDRAITIKNVWEALEKIHGPGSSHEQKQRGKKDLDRFKEGGHAHASCARSFEHLFNKDPKAARHHYDAACKTYDDRVLGKST